MASTLRVVMAELLLWRVLLVSVVVPLELMRLITAVLLVHVVPWPLSWRIPLSSESRWYCYPYRCWSPNRGATLVLLNARTKPVDVGVNDLVDTGAG